MLIPYRTDAPIYHFPYATIGLIAVNVIAFALMASNQLAGAEQWILVYGDGLHPVQWISSMFIHGGITSNGVRCTCPVLGAYWISCMRSFWKTTLPGVMARFRPTSKASSSLVLIFSWPPLSARSEIRLFRPSIRFLPPDSARDYDPSPTPFQSRSCLSQTNR